jgi:putative DNA primase/helicase
MEQGSGGSYYLHLDPPTSGWCKNYQTGKEAIWRDKKSAAFGKEGFTRFLARFEADRKTRQKEDTNRQTEAQTRALQIYKSARRAPLEHPYLLEKGVRPLGDIRMAPDGRLIIPVHDAMGILQSIQFITDTGEERFLFGGITQAQGGFFPIRGGEGPVYIVESYATGSTIHEATGETVLVAFNSDNFLAVAQAAHGIYPNRQLVLCANDNQGTVVGMSRNQGLAKAREAAASIGGLLAVPMFQAPTDKTNFSDLALAEGLETVKDCLARVLTSPSSGTGSGKIVDKSLLVALNASEFLRYEFPQREYILEPILTTQGLALLYAPRGLGKTFLALSIANGVAVGLPVLRWKTPRPRRVLFVDGEMQGWMMRERLNGIMKGFGMELPRPDFLQIITPDLQQEFVPNLATLEGQTALEPHLAGVELLIIDNLATLCRVGKENEAESWLPIQAWILHLRRRGISVILVHHANKNGAQRGTSSREDVMDTVIALRPAEEHRSGDGARFEVHLEKARGIGGGMGDPFEAILVSKGDAFFWTTKDLGDDNPREIARLYAEGASCRDIERKTGISKSRVQRILKQLPPREVTATSRALAGRRVPVSQL